jgi:hypothetical protein
MADFSLGDIILYDGSYYEIKKYSNDSQQTYYAFKPININCEKTDCVCCKFMYGLCRRSFLSMEELDNYFFNFRHLIKLVGKIMPEKEN